MVLYYYIKQNKKVQAQDDQYVERESEREWEESNKYDDDCDKLRDKTHKSKTPSHQKHLASIPKNKLPNTWAAKSCGMGTSS